MARKFKNGDNVITVCDSARGLYMEGFTGVVMDSRKPRGEEVEYLIKYDQKSNRTWTKESSLMLLADHILSNAIENGTKIVAINASPKGLYVAGMTGIVEDKRLAGDNIEYKVQFDNKKQGTKTWVDGANVAVVYSPEIEDEDDDDFDDCDCPCGNCTETDFEATGIIIGKCELIPMSTIKIVKSGFGYYVVVDMFGMTRTIEKQNILIYNPAKPLYVRVADLRKLKQHGMHFDSDSNLCYLDEDDLPFILAEELDCIGKSFVIKNIDFDEELITVKGTEAIFSFDDLLDGFIEVKD